MLLAGVFLTESYQAIACQAIACQAIACPFAPELCLIVSARGELVRPLAEFAYGMKFPRFFIVCQDSR